MSLFAKFQTVRRDLQDYFGISIYWKRIISSNFLAIIATENVDCFAVDRNRHLAILHPQRLSCLPMLKSSGYYVCYTLRDYGHIQVQMYWIWHFCIAVVNDHQGDIIGGYAQKCIDKIVRPKCYSRPVF